MRAFLIIQITHLSPNNFCFNICWVIVLQLITMLCDRSVWAPNAAEIWLSIRTLYKCAKLVILMNNEESVNLCQPNFLFFFTYSVIRRCVRGQQWLGRCRSYNTLVPKLSRAEPSRAGGKVALEWLIMLNVATCEQEKKPIQSPKLLYWSPPPQGWGC